MKRRVTQSHQAFAKKQAVHKQRRKARNHAYRDELRLAPIKAGRFMMKREQETQDIINKLLGRPGTSKSSKS